MTPEEIATKIRQLRMEELMELKLLLEDWPEWGEGGIGVREPRVPAPESPGDEIALPEDYWETAQ